MPPSEPLADPVQSSEATGSLWTSPALTKFSPRSLKMTITPLVEKVPRAASAPGPLSRLCARSYEVARGEGGGSANAARAAASAEPNVALVQRKI